MLIQLYIFPAQYWFSIIAIKILLFTWFLSLCYIIDTSLLVQQERQIATHLTLMDYCIKVALDSCQYYRLCNLEMLS